MKVALVVGATGLIGGQLLDLLLADDRYRRVIAISRKPLEKTNAKFHNLVTSADTLDQFSSQINADDVFCCLGTTMKKAKSKEAFRRIDFEYPFTVARLARAQGAKRFLLVSALGANPSSSIFYNRVKGEIEEAIAAIGFEGYHIFRPSLLLGPRAEHRSGEAAAQWVYGGLGFLLPAKYKAIESIRVARAMIEFASSESNGKGIHESGELQKF